MVQTRTEEDLLGTREIPDEAYYGVHTQRAIDNFHISGVTINDVPEFIRGMVSVKKAEALANRDKHVLSARVSRAIVDACDLILNDGRCMDQFPVDVFQGGAGTSVNMNTNEVVANLALETLGEPKGKYDVINPNDHVNKSQSTNDAYPTGFRIAVYRMIQQLAEEVDRMRASFAAIGAKNAHVLKMGRTQLQDAVPMTVGQEFDAFGVLMSEEIRNLTRASELLLEVNLGATAIGTKLNTPDGFQEIVVGRLAEVTGLNVTASPNLIEATSDTGAYISVHGALKRLAVKLSMICNDLRLLSSGPRAGLNEINLPEMQAGSSIMPAKVNPVIPEVVNQICFKVMGNDTTVMMASEAGQLQLNVMEPVIGQAIFESISLLTRAMVTLRERCVDGITVNEDICMSYVMNSIGIVTYLNDIIGHHNGDLIGKEAARTGKSVRDIVLERGLMSETELNRTLSVENLMTPVYMGETFPEESEKEIHD
ncbi:aspartate ammonia-lyase [Arcanobacterium haemolyticum]|uniref:Aspartate ammonia-lyase n=1 Tax=Arcanobacterium haemolyticum (strain ATCC 9345 / DSM 20595 / CCM 5947 / CCUG 17215 / LMG 16163 / NBRC 15585 / NCTC 8452 / 11018) TaxID=644284 RepID=D7BMN3_ARCHD|nr:aspartate ammonia-lyase [Arcanobacterium haemolyticum]ADH92182.1 aspartate ammonia-lyase [Arcanobacterium haemolyticum DSM 20595]QCX46341.1 aspartate ammonia-lyase [Arcanobacterium haemolyticum]SPT75796.1 Aspartate ammonia-lyase [Arcanobacterium haemolyticum]SQH29113.1 Aspartate ammonia-lyase [Arcanobacterium haemolyticum]